MSSAEFEVVSVTVVPERTPPPTTAVDRPMETALVGLDVALGVAAILADRIDGVGRSVTRRTTPVVALVLRPPLVGTRLQPGHWLDKVVDRGQRERVLVVGQLDRLLDALVPLVTAELLSRIDKDTLNGLVEDVLDTIDLPSIIRESSGSMASETVQGARMQAIAGDEAIARIVDRLLFRRRARAAEGTSPAPAGTTTDGTADAAPPGAAGDGAVAL